MAVETKKPPIAANTAVENTLGLGGCPQSHAE
jgi:hypothetical protein